MAVDHQKRAGRGRLHTINGARERRFGLDSLALVINRGNRNIVGAGLGLAAEFAQSVPLDLIAARRRVSVQFTNQFTVAIQDFDVGRGRRFLEIIGDRRPAILDQINLVRCQLDLRTQGTARPQLSGLSAKDRPCLRVLRWSQSPARPRKTEPIAR